MLGRLRFVGKHLLSQASLHLWRQLPPATPCVTAKRDLHLSRERADQFLRANVVTRPLDTPEVPFGCQGFLVFQQLLGLAPQREGNQHERFPGFDLLRIRQKSDSLHGLHTIAEAIAMRLPGSSTSPQRCYNGSGYRW